MFKKGRLVFGLTLLLFVLTLPLVGSVFAVENPAPLNPPSCPDDNPACHPPINVSEFNQRKVGGFLSESYLTSPLFKVFKSSLTTDALHAVTAVRGIIAGGGAENNGTDNFLHIFGLAKTLTGNHVTGKLDRWTKIWDNLSVPGEIRASNYYICPTPDSCSLIDGSGGGFWAAALDPSDKRIHNTNGAGIIVNSGTTITGNTISFPVGSAVIGTEQASPLGLKTGGINKIYITSAGNVGIGDNINPTDFKLQVAGDVGPNTDNDSSLGSATKRWANLYASEINICTENGSCSPITGGSGSNWTVSGANIYRPAGNVGIGTSAPGNKLSIVGLGGNSIDLAVNGRIKSGDTTNNGGLWAGASSFFGQTGTVGEVGIYNKSLWSLLVKDDGKVGIGTASPKGKLGVANGSSGEVAPYTYGDDLVVESNSHAGMSVLAPTGSYSGIFLGDAETPRGGQMMWRTKSGVSTLSLGTHDTGNVNLASAGNLNFSAKGIQRAIITPDGNVGIGTTNPNLFKLQVDGDVGPNTDNASSLGSATKRWANLYASEINICTENGSCSPITGGSGSNWTVSGANIYRTSKVGIGTASPKGKLGVANGSSGEVAPYTYGDDLVVESNSHAGMSVLAPTGSYSGIFLGDAETPRGGQMMWRTKSGVSTLSLGTHDTGNVNLASAGNLNFSAKGIQRAIITPDGNVGIGTSAPGNKLSIVGLGGNSIDLAVNGRIKSGDTTNNGGLWAGASSFFGQTGTVGEVGIYNKSLWSLLVKDDGKVGIGTASPKGKLGVANGSSGEVAPYTYGDDLVVESNSHAGMSVLAPTGSYSGIFLGDAETPRGGQMMWRTKSGVSTLSLGTHDTGNVNLASAGNLNFSAKGIQRAIITPDGNVGIGTTNPNLFKLQVDGDVGPNTDNASSLGSATKRWANLYASEINICTENGSCSPITGGSGSNWTVSGANIYRTSKVGIGTASPKGKLGVANGSSGEVAPYTYGDDLVVESNSHAGMSVLAPTGSYSGIFLGDAETPRGGQMMWRTKSGVSTLSLGTHDTGNVNLASAGNLNFSAKGIQRAIITPDGNVGIGTSAPGNKLSIVGLGGNSIDLAVNGRIKSGDTTNNGGLWAGASSFFGQTGTVGEVGIYNKSRWSLLVKDDGKVGIGTASPKGKLGVANGSSGEVAPYTYGDDLVVESNSHAGMSVLAPTGSYSGIFLGDAETPRGGQMMWRTKSGVSTLSLGTHDTGNVNLASAGNLNFSAKGIQRAIITPDGNVGIGTTNPNLFKLQVDGDVGPNTDNASSLGSATKRWANLYASEINICTENGSCSPITGGSGSNWTVSGANIYRTSSVGVGASPANPTDFKLQVAGHAGPNANNTYNLGSSAMKWLNLYATNVRATDVYATDVNTNRICSADGFSCIKVTDLGGSGSKWTQGTGDNIYRTSSVGIGASPANPTDFKLQVAGHAGPNANNTYNLGSSDKRWANLYATNVNTNRICSADGSSNCINVTDLGGGGSNWTVSGTNIYRTSNVGIGASPTDFRLQVAGDVGPNANKANSLGSLDKRWKNLYVSTVDASSNINTVNVNVSGTVETNIVNAGTANMNNVTVANIKDIAGVGLHLFTGGVERAKIDGNGKGFHFLTEVMYLPMNYSNYPPFPCESSVRGAMYFEHNAEEDEICVCKRHSYVYHPFSPYSGDSFLWMKVGTEGLEDGLGTAVCSHGN